MGVNEITGSKPDWRSPGAGFETFLRVVHEQDEKQEQECEHLHWERGHEYGDDGVTCLDCGEKGAVVWDTDVKKRIADQLKGLT